MIKSARNSAASARLAISELGRRVGLMVVQTSFLCFTSLRGAIQSLDLSGNLACHQESMAVICKTEFLVKYHNSPSEAGVRP